MTDPQINTTALALLCMEREIDAMQEVCDAHRAKLIKEARRRKSEHAATENGGSSWTRALSNGCELSITFPVRSLQKSITGDKMDQLGKLGVPPAQYSGFFERVTVFTLKKDFRKKVLKTFSGKLAARILRLCTGDKATPQFRFKAKEAE